ncbi:MAG TPA: amidohydrolase family protein, partial [Acidobacteriota bacterium]|nr:amidohydrolase family protein [Acidobacteriota bacterium]
MNKAHIKAALPGNARDLPRGRLARLILLGILVLPGFCLTWQRDNASLAILNARIWTGNPQQPWAQAVAISGDRILTVGTDEEIRRTIQSATQVYDGGGDTVTPGFIDAHFHIMDIDASRGEDPINLRFVTTRQGFVDRVKKRSANLPAGAWIFGEGWDERKWGGELPSKGWIDSITPQNPTWLLRNFGSVGLANSAALRAAGITRDTKEPPAGGIVRDAAGE